MMKYDIMIKGVSEIDHLYPLTTMYSYRKVKVVIWLKELVITMIKIS